MAGRGGPRNRVIDHVAPGAETDPDFLKMKRELEDNQQRQGWLFGVGAFDRQDIAYLKEHKEEVITKEQELDEFALDEFARLKSQVSAELDASMPQPGAGTVLLAVKHKKEMKPVAKLLAIKIAPASKQAPAALRSPAATSPKAAPAKRAGLASEHDGGPSKVAKQNEEVSGGLAGLLGDYSDDEDEQGPTPQLNDSVPQTGSSEKAALGNPQLCATKGQTEANAGAGQGGGQGGGSSRP